MRYYVYVSDSKLEMLYEQIPTAKREQIAGELSINLGLVKTKFSSETIAAGRHQKIEIVREFLGKKAGGLNEKAPYVHTTATATWGAFGEFSDVVYFGGYADNFQIALVGSHCNCIGSEGKAAPTGYSLSPYIIELLSRRKCLPPLGYGRRNLPAADIIKSAREAVIHTNECSIQPKIKIEFLARTVEYYQSQDEEMKESVYIGSPIYVAESD